MCQKPVIEVEGLSKRYRILKSLQKDSRNNRGAIDFLKTPFSRLGEIIGLTHFSNGNDDSIFWALKDLNFEIKHGEVFGIIGKNGAGKSTLLKVLSRITAPSEGRIKIRGRVSSLLEVGTGFHPELTGRENIYMNGTLHGMSKKEIDGKLDDIIDFAGVSQFVDMPIKRYSSGMGVRLGFAVAAFLEPEILIVDEVLAVGDAEFRKKCGNKMTEVSKEGKTVLLVSHNMGIIESMCENAIVLDKGSIDFHGTAKDAVRHYLYERSDLIYFEDTGKMNLTEHEGRKTKFDQLMKLDEVTLYNDKGEATFNHEIGKSIRFEIAYHFEKKSRFDNFEFGIAIKNDHEVVVHYMSNYMAESEISHLEDKGVVNCLVENLALAPGDYWVNLRCRCGSFWSDSIISAFRLSISGEIFESIGKTPLNPEDAVVVTKSRWF